MKKKFKGGTQYNNLFFKADSIQVFDYILSKNNEERESTFKNILLCLKEQLLSFESKDEIITRYLFENIKLCFNIYKNFQGDSKINNEILYLLNTNSRKFKTIKIQPINYDEIFYFNDTFFLNPENIYSQLKQNYEFNDISEYKNILEHILLISNINIKEKYKKNNYLNNILSIDIIKLKLYNSSYNTIKKYSYNIYNSNIKNINYIPQETIIIYNKIFSRINQTVNF